MAMRHESMESLRMAMRHESMESFLKWKVNNENVRDEVGYHHTNKAGHSETSSDSAAASSSMSTPAVQDDGEVLGAAYDHAAFMGIHHDECGLMFSSGTRGGDDRGWAPHSDFHGWASGKIFLIGDNLWFACASGEQSVIELKSKEEWEACNVSNPIRLYNGGVDSVPLFHVGTRYFSSRRVDDCQNGMKFRINVDAAPPLSEPQTRPESDDGILGNLISRENLQKMGKWSLSWPASDEIWTVMGTVKEVAEAPTSGSSTFSAYSIFSSIVLKASFHGCCVLYISFTLHFTFRK